MPVHLPIAPPPVASENQAGDAEFTPKQADMHARVLAHFSQPTYSLPNAEKGELREEEKFWLSYECISRYLRAVKWGSAEKAISRLEQSLRWRREFGLYDLVTDAHVEPEAVTGKEILFGYDSARRPAFYMVPSRQNTQEGPRQIQFTVWALERCIDLMGPGVETLDLLINYGDRGRNPSFDTSRTVLNILQDHYPERLGLALIINVPLIVNAFFKLIMPFIDPITRPKLRFNPDVIKEGIFAPDMIMQQWWGGTQDFTYEHDKYWPALVAMCEERRKQQLEAWRSLGARVGLKEWDVKNACVETSSKKVEKEVEGVTEAVEAIECVS